jgi:thiosulfate/3-mercaptopyruvate sulfurtransferase
VDAGGVQLWDTRTKAEWDGENDRGNARAGHVPGAVWLEWVELLEGPPAHRFRPLEEIRQTMVAAGIDPEAETITY